uniref:Uncharacterized protein n=1 Tax=Romanomermis culicivorax TaxID=13658 RepID=A0A915KIK6_ROMCU
MPDKLAKPLANPIKIPAYRGAMSNVLTLNPCGLKERSLQNCGIQPRSIGGEQRPEKEPNDAQAS